MAPRTPNGRAALASASLPGPARELCDWLAGHDWDFRRAAKARQMEPRLLYRQWLESLDWNQSLAARLYRREGRAVTRQAIEAQMKSCGVVRPLDVPKLLKGQDFEGGLDALHAVHAFVREKSSPERLCCEQLLALADTYWTMGAPVEARAALVQVVKLARRTGELAIVARAVRALPDLGFQTRGYGSYDAELVELLEGWLGMLREAGDPTALALALGLLALELYGSGRPGTRERARALGAEALESARASGRPDVLSTVAAEWALTRSDAAHLEERLETLETLVATVPFEDDHRYHVLNLILNDLIEAGRFDETSDVRDELRQLEEGSVLPWPQRYRVTLCILRGEWKEAERLAVLPTGVPLESSAQIRGLQQFEAMKLRGDWENLAGLVRWSLNQEPGFVGWQIASAEVAALRGRLEGVPEAVAEWAVDDFACLPDDLLRVTNLCMIGEICAAADCTEAAEQLYPLLASCRERVAIIRVNAAILGSVARYLGLLATTLGDWERATDDFELAVKTNEKLEARPYLAWTRFDYACMLRRAGREPDKALSLTRSASRDADLLGMDWLVARADALASEID